MKIAHGGGMMRSVVLLVLTAAGGLACSPPTSEAFLPEAGGAKADDATGHSHLRLAAFIQCQVVEGPFTWYEGDDRDFGLAQALTHSRIYLDVELDPAAADGLARVSGRIGESHAYPGAQTYRTGDDTCPRRLRQDAVMSAYATASLDDVGARGAWLWRSTTVPRTGTLRVRLDASASNPLEPLAPAADLELDVVLDILDGQVLAYEIDGAHDGYPAYELYLDDHQLYTFDANEHGNGPVAMFPPMDVDVHIPSTTLGD
jgi:hypothetical protein